MAADGSVYVPSDVVLFKVQGDSSVSAVVMVDNGYDVNVRVRGGDGKYIPSRYDEDTMHSAQITVTETNQGAGSFKEIVLQGGINNTLRVTSVGNYTYVITLQWPSFIDSNVTLSYNKYPAV